MCHSKKVDHILQEDYLEIPQYWVHCSGQRKIKILKINHWLLLLKVEFGCAAVG